MKVATQTIKLDPTTLGGHTVEIGSRADHKVIEDGERRELGADQAANPAFDVNLPRHVDVIVTESGCFRP